MRTIYIIILTLFIELSSVVQIHAQATPPIPNDAVSTTQPTTTITNSKNNDSLTEKINNLKDKIASRVAELNLVEKRGVIGTVTERSATQITIRDSEGASRSIDVDEITKFDSPGVANFGISDIEKGANIGAVGIYNKQSKRILARFVDVISLPVMISGVVVTTDEDEFTLVIASENEKKYTVDFEKTTKSNTYVKDGGLTKIGFKDIAPGERTIIVGFADKDEENRISATRILLFPEYPRNPKIDVDIKIEPTEDATPTPTLRLRQTIIPTKRSTQ